LLTGAAKTVYEKRDEQHMRRKTGPHKNFQPAASPSPRDALFFSAVKHHERGQFREAEKMYARILRNNPTHADALHMFGVLKHQTSGFDESHDLITRAITLKPDKAVYYYCLGNLFMDTGKVDDAIGAYRKAITLNPDHAESHSKLGTALFSQGREEDALVSIKHALEIKPDSFDANFAMGTALYKMEQYEEAIDFLQEAVKLNPDFSQAHYNLGTALRYNHNYTDAIKHLQKALKLMPDNADALNNLGLTLLDIGEINDGVSCLRQASALNPESAESLYNLGLGLDKQHRISEAIPCYQKAIALKPDFSSAYNNMANLLKDQGRLAESLACYYKSLELKPVNAPGTHSNILLMIQYTEPIDPDMIFRQHQRWAKIYVAPLKTLIPVHTNDKSPERRLKIGYVSPDFRTHSVSYFIEPIIESHDREHFEIFCYSNLDRPDNKTIEFKNLADHWRDICRMPDDEAAQLIQKDGIDILVDLSGHTGNNRITLFARKPAPVQITYIGYPNTTGLDTIDYRMTDAWTDPPGRTDHLHTEKIIRLPRGFLCYKPPEESPDVRTLPASVSGFITYGCFNNRSKISDRTIGVWSEILHLIPGSRLILKATAFHDEPTKNYVLELFEKSGIAAARVDVYGDIPSKAGHLDLYNSIDIGLDTFPYNGTTTTCEALWMGVPVIALKGDIHISRVSYSILSNIGLAELVAESTDEYIMKAVNLAGDIERLNTLRRNLRSMMKNSCFMDKDNFTRTLEQEYRSMWRRWCNEQQTKKENPDADPDLLGEQVDILIREGEDLFNSGYVLDAKCAFLQALDKDPENTAALNDLGVLYWHTAHTEKAIETFNRVLTIDPEYLDARLNLEEIFKTLPVQNEGDNPET
jgi:predicted O-linked N-acetylglucosamine transferase (SPINDLY family)